MNVFERAGKFNFVDRHNRIVGYDTNASCCEAADWLITASNPEQLTPPLSEWYVVEPHARMLKPYIFDPHWFHERNDGDDGVWDEYNYAAFQLRHEETGEILYLVLYNIHNGYYGHGFTFSKGDTIIRDGTI